MIDAQRAYEIGLVNKVVKPEELMPRTEEMARKIMSKGMFGVSLAKAFINNGMNMDMESAINMKLICLVFAFATDQKKV